MNISDSNNSLDEFEYCICTAVAERAQYLVYKAIERQQTDVRDAIQTATIAGLGAHKQLDAPKKYDEMTVMKFVVNKFKDLLDEDMHSHNADGITSWMV